MNDAIETAEYKDLNINVYQDDMGDDPRQWDNLGTMVFFHKRYTVGDKHDFNSEDYNGWDEMEKGVEKEFGTSVILPVYMYEHSGIGFSTDNSKYPFNDRWDAGRLGFIFVSKKDVRKEYGKAGVKEIELAKQVLKDEVELYSKFYNGECYLVNIENKDGEVLDTLSGFYDSDEALTEGTRIAKGIESRIEKMKPTKERKELEEAGQIPLAFN